MSAAASKPSAGRDAAIVFLSVAVVFLISPVQTNHDSKWVFPTAISLAREGDVSLNEWPKTLSGYTHGVHQPDGARWVSYFPLGPAFTVLPLVAVMEAATAMEVPKIAAAWRRNAPASGEINLDFFDLPGRIVASLLCALAAAFLYLALRERTSRGGALLIAFTFAFGTSTWSMASRAIWQHGPAMLFISLLLWATLRSRDDARLAWPALAGAAGALAYVMRPTALPIALAMGLVVAVWRPKKAWALVAAALLVLGPWFTLNLQVFEALLPPYYAAGRLTLGPTFPEALLGNLVSPARGLLLYTPLFLSIPALILLLGPRAFRSFEYLLLALIGFHWAAVSAFPHWWAGHSYGPRLFCEVLPLLCLLLAPVLDAVRSDGRGRKPAAFALGLAAVVGFTLHFSGAFSSRVHAWNSDPRDVDHAPERLWDWRDPPFLRIGG